MSLPPSSSFSWVVVLTRRGFEAQPRQPTKADPLRYHREDVARSVASGLNAALLRGFPQK